MATKNQDFQLTLTEASSNLFSVAMLCVKGFKVTQQSRSFKLVQIG